MTKERKGFSLLEALISLFFFLLIVIFSLDCFLSVKSHFVMLKESEITHTAVHAALDRMRRDLFEAGLGLTEAIEMQVLDGISDESGELVILSASEDLVLGGDLASGQRQIFTPDALSVKKGHLIVIFDPFRGEVHSVASTDLLRIMIESPLVSDYSQENTKMILLRKIALFFDEADGVLRRKVNASPAQPLLENVASFGFDYVQDTNVVKIELCLNSDEERKYETTLFPKNTAISSITLEK